MDSIYILTEGGELQHWGIKGMRWGVRRYQTKNGSLTPAGKKRYEKDMAKVKAETKRLKNQQRTDAKMSKLEAAKKNLQALKKGKKGESEADENVEDIEAKKAKILESRSAKEIYKNANLFTTNELQAAKFRLELERNIKSLEPPEVDKGKEFANKFIEKADTASAMIQSGSKAYNNVAKIYNSFFGNKNGVTLPMINENVKSKLDKFKDETEWIKAKNERKKAQEDAKEKVKTELEKLREETAWIDAQNKNREAKRASKKHDESDRKEAEKAAKEAAAKEAEKKRKEEMGKYEEYNKPYTDPPRSGTSTTTDTEYRNKGGERSYTNPNESRGLALYNRPSGDLDSSSKSSPSPGASSNSTSVTSLATSGKSYMNNYSGWDRSYSALPEHGSVPKGKRIAGEVIDKDGSLIVIYEDDD